MKQKLDQRMETLWGRFRNPETGETSRAPKGAITSQVGSFECLPGKIYLRMLPGSIYLSVLPGIICLSVFTWEDIPGNVTWVYLPECVA